MKTMGLKTRMVLYQIFHVPTKIVMHSFCFIPQTEVEVQLEIVDMLFNGHHKLSPDEHHAFAKAARNRIALGKRADEVRRSMAKTLSRHFNYKHQERGTIWE